MSHYRPQIPPSSGLMSHDPLGCCFARHAWACLHDKVVVMLRSESSAGKAALCWISQHQRMGIQTYRPSKHATLDVLFPTKEDKWGEQAIASGRFSMRILCLQTLPCMLILTLVCAWSTRPWVIYSHYTLATDFQSASEQICHADHVWYFWQLQAWWGVSADGTQWLLQDFSPLCSRRTHPWVRPPPPPPPFHHDAFSSLSFMKIID